MNAIMRWMVEKHRRLPARNYHNYKSSLTATPWQWARTLGSYLQMCGEIDRNYGAELVRKAPSAHTRTLSISVFRPKKTSAWKNLKDTRAVCQPTSGRSWFSSWLRVPRFSRKSADMLLEDPKYPISHSHLSTGSKLGILSICEILGIQACL